MCLTLFMHFQHIKSFNLCNIGERWALLPLSMFYWWEWILEHRDIKKFIQSHPASEWENWASDPAVWLQRVRVTTGLCCLSVILLSAAGRLPALWFYTSDITWLEKIVHVCRVQEVRFLCHDVTVWESWLCTCLTRMSHNHCPVPHRFSGLHKSL